MVAHGTPCLGPVTHAGCGALCPAYDRGCYGCFGPMETPNTRARSRAGWARLGMTTPDLVRVFRTFNAERRAVPARERGAGGSRTMTASDARARSRSTTWPASRARAVSPSSCRDGRVDEVRLEIFEPPRFFEALPARPRVHRGARHHVAHLRHLPGRLPDERRATRWRTRSASGSTARCGRCGGCSTAASGSRATRCTSTAARPGLPRLPGRDRAWRKDHREAVQRGLAAQEGRQRDRGAARRPRDPPGQRAGRRLLPRADAGRARAARRATRAGRATPRSRACAGWRASSSRTSSATTSSWRSAIPTSTR